MPLLRFAVICLLLLLSTLSQAEDTYAVSNVYDGDTVELKSTGGRFKLRLSDIDAPERNQEYGQKARRALIKLCKNNNVKVTVELSGKDKYDRHLGRLQCGHTDVSLYMAENGYAWYNEKYSDDIAIKNAAETARRDRVGLWSADQPMPPWVWRHLHGNAYQSGR